MTNILRYKGVSKASGQDSLECDYVGSYFMCRQSQGRPFVKAVEYRYLLKGKVVQY